jgi:hypothetical protein
MESVTDAGACVGFVVGSANEMYAMPHLVLKFNIAIPAALSN